MNLRLRVEPQGAREHGPWQRRVELYFSEQAPQPEATTVGDGPTRGVTP